MDKLGIEPSLLLAQIVNFLIIVAVLSTLLFKPILKMLEKRRKEIAEGLAITQQMRQEEEKLQAKREKVLEAARSDGQKIVEEHRKQGKEEEKDLLSEAHKEAEEIVNKGKEEVIRLHQELAKDLRREAVVMAEAMAKQIVGKVLTNPDQHRLLDKELTQLEKTKFS